MPSNFHQEVSYQFTRSLKRSKNCHLKWTRRIQLCHPKPLFDSLMLVLLTISLRTPRSGRWKDVTSLGDAPFLFILPTNDSYVMLKETLFVCSSNFLATIWFEFHFFPNKSLQDHAQLKALQSFHYHMINF